MEMPKKTTMAYRGEVITLMSEAEAVHMRRLLTVLIDGLRTLETIDPVACDAEQAKMGVAAVDALRRELLEPLNLMLDNVGFNLANAAQSILFNVKQ